ncbi:helix-turn-helix domain-containing protein, partial [Salmonella enterica subsp. enterica serovar Weltevreden]|nr:helix-turn-helix domain-containing protein [Salmonella enterica subsp. enterica serovar Weltevreden]
MSTQKNTFRHVSESLKTSIMQNRGGQKVIERILVAYGFTSRQAFCNHLGISQSTMANRYARD